MEELEENEEEKYEMMGLIGRGACGEVYKGRDKRSGGYVAIKQISMSKLNKKRENELEKEISLLKSLRHEHIVKILDNWKDSKTGKICLVLEFMENGSLAKTLNEIGPFPENIVSDYLCQALTGVAYLHKQHIIHRDIKGENLLLSGNGSVRLADFGLAKKISPSGDDFQDTSNNSTCNSVPDTVGDDEDAVGTPYWLAPEVILMMGATLASDIWSIGCTAVELLTGQPPYGNLSPMAAIFRTVSQEIRPVLSGFADAGEWSSGARLFVSSCLRKEPLQRPSADQLLKGDYRDSKKGHTEHFSNWLPRIGEAEVTLRTARKSISLHQSQKIRESIAKNIRQSAEEVHLISEAPDISCDAELEEAIEEKTRASGGELEELVSRLQARLYFLEKRMRKSRSKEWTLTHLGKVYSRWISSVEADCERQRDSLRQLVRSDQSSIRSIRRQLDKLSETQSGEHQESIAAMTMKEVQATTKRDKLGGFFGAAPNEVAEALSSDVRLSQLHLDASPSKKLHGRTHSLLEKFLPRTLRSKSLSKSGSFVLHADPRDTERIEACFLKAMLANRPQDLTVDGASDYSFFEEGKEVVYQGLIWLQEKTEKAERHAFLFQECLAFAKILYPTSPRPSNWDESKPDIDIGLDYRLDFVVPLESARVIYVGDEQDDSHYLGCFQIEEGGRTWTCYPIDLYQREGEKRNEWVHNLRACIKRFQMQRIESYRKLSEAPACDSGNQAPGQTTTWLPCKPRVASFLALHPSEE